MTKVRASVQYGDWEGTAAADDDADIDLSDFLEKKGLYDREIEFLVAVEVLIGENHGGKVKPPYIRCLIQDKPDFDTVADHLAAQPDPLTFKSVDIELTLEEFIGLFKRFAVTLSRRGLNLTDREFTRT